jgi:SAM-dependent methyltransferase
MTLKTDGNGFVPLWDAERVAREISEGAIFETLGEAARNELKGIAGVGEKAAGALRNPKPLDINMPVLNAVLAAQYYEVFEALQPPRTLAVYEPCVGASCPVILAAEAYSGGRGSYLSLNLNKKLREELRAKIEHLRMPVKIVEEHAEQALSLLSPGSFDVACFHHAVNDILQTAVSEPRGMDTTAVDWFPNERQMIEWMDEDAKAGRLEGRGKPELMRIVGDAVRLVRPGGFLVFDHFNWCRFIGVDWFPWDLFYNLIPMTRQWVRESGLPVSEVPLEGMDPQWWMVLRTNTEE